MDYLLQPAHFGGAMLGLHIVMTLCLFAAIALAIAAQRSGDDSWFFTLIAAVIIEVVFICIGLLAHQYDLLIFAVVSIGLELIAYQLAAYLERRSFATRT